MDTTEAAQLRERLVKFNKLQEIAGGLRKIIEATTSKVEGSEDSPFTGNTRESRTLNRLDISFSKTRGGADACCMSIHIDLLFMEAYEFGRWLEAKARERLAEAMEEISKL